MATLTIADKIKLAGGPTSGFDWWRIGLSLSILIWHALALSDGSAAADLARWTGPFRWIPNGLVPIFFALSGFLVAGSLLRTKLHQFVTLRVIRLFPALAVEIALSAILLGALLTELPLGDYLAHPSFRAYFLNVVGNIHYTLPGLFEHNPLPRIVNGQLWTIPYELDCYEALILLSFLTIVRRRFLLVAAVALMSVGLTAYVIAGHPVDPTTHMPGPAIVLSFLAAVSLYLLRDVVPYSRWLGIASGVVSIALLQIPDGCYLAAFPLAYFTVWIGLMRPPALPFGDLSYGVFLFHYPVLQTIMRLVPGIDAWWQLVLLSLPATMLCAWMSWTFVEHPILARKKLVLGLVDGIWAYVTRPVVWAGARLRRSA